MPLFLSAAPVNLGSHVWRYTEGFSEEWIALPPDISEWKSFSGRRIEGRFQFEDASSSPFTFTAACLFDSPIKNRKSIDVAAVLLPRIGMNWSIFLNGKKLDEDIHLSRDGSKILKNRSVRKHLISFPAALLQEKENLLMVQITGDPDYELTGITVHNLKVGLEKELDRRIECTFNFGIIMVFLVAGLYHFVLFFKRRKDRFNLYFGLYASLSAIYMLLRAHLIFTLLPDINTTFLTRTELVVLFPLVALFIAFLESLFKQKLSKFSVYYLLYNSFLAVIAAFVPITWIVIILYVWQVSALITVPYILYLIIDAFRKKIQEASALLLGTLLIVGTAIYDIMDSIILNTHYGVFRAGFFVFMLGIIASLGNRFMRVHNEVEDLTLHLEEKVRDRTDELEAAMTELQATNDYITEINHIHERDMQLASTVQRGLIPWDRIYDKWDIQVFFKPASTVSGDFYDIYTHDDDSVTIVLTDVSGHGISSALITMIAKPVLYQNFGKEASSALGDSMCDTNRQLIESIGNIDKYLTAVAIRLTADSVSFSNAAHPSAFFLSKMHGLRAISASGTILGINEMQSQYETVRFDAHPGDMVLTYTDAIIESKNPAGEEFGEDRITEILTSGEMEPDELIDTLYQKLRDFTGKDILEDDLTIIACRRKP